jgi:EAL domain-containing protein (putative c-di-GMP-specific phosphodiesterase class I)
MKFSNLSKLFECRLCVTITMGVFALILVIESVLLVPSSIRFQQVEQERYAERIHLMVEPALMLGAGLSGDGPLARDVATLVAQQDLKAMAVYSTDGRELARVGTLPTTIHVSNHVARTANAKLYTEKISSTLMLTQWRSDARGTPTIAVISDISKIRTDLFAYLLRIGGLILLIVMVVTLGTMLLLYQLLLRPILRLRSSALSAGDSPRHAATFRLQHQRRDELGDLIDAFNAMLTHVSDSIERDAEQALVRERHALRHDLRTGLPNRLALLERLQQHDVNSVGTHISSTHLALLLIRYHDASLARANAPMLAQGGLQSVATEGDFIAQLDPLLFAVVRFKPKHGKQIAGNSASLAQAIIQLEKIKANLMNSHALVDVRVGIVESFVGAMDGETLLNQAEFALNRAIADPNMHYQFFDPDEADAAWQRQRLMQDLVYGLKHNELEVWYQPKVALQDGDQLAGAEALVRWKHPRLGLLSPAIFIPLAESTGQIEALDWFVLRTVANQIAGWHQRFGQAPRVAVNLAALHFASAQLVDELEALIAEVGIDKKYLEIEITETSAMNNSAAATRTLNQLRKSGIHTAIDDFGTGYSSLAYLHQFAVDTLKIDRSFVNAIGRHSQNETQSETICVTILHLGHAMGKDIVAEGVETAAQAEFLRSRGCEYAQGFLYGPAVNASLFAATWLQPEQTVATASQRRLAVAG